MESVMISLGFAAFVFWFLWRDAVSGVRYWERQANYYQRKRDEAWDERLRLLKLLEGEDEAD